MLKNVLHETWKIIQSENTTWNREQFSFHRKWIQQSIIDGQAFPRMSRGAQGDTDKQMTSKQTNKKEYWPEGNLSEDSLNRMRRKAIERKQRDESKKKK